VLLKLGSLSRQARCVGFGSLRQLLKSPHKLMILGDGTQIKPHIQVHNTVGAVLLGADRSALQCAAHCVATGDYTAVTEIVEPAVECGASVAGKDGN
jgi:nucleoside-diphosphate-sugar epimerase